MKKLLAALVLCIMLFPVNAFVETDITALSTEALHALRQEINDELGRRAYPLQITEAMTIIEVFPDKVLAKSIRDKIGAFSINDTVTQEQLDSIKEVKFLSMNDGLSSLEGIQYLSNLQELSLYYQKDLKEIPDRIGDLILLKRLSLKRCGISGLPDSICNLINLESLEISDTDVSALPADIGNLAKLKKLDISNTLITELPQSIYALTLDTFNREGLDIE